MADEVKRPSVSLSARWTIDEHKEAGGDLLDAVRGGNSDAVEAALSKWMDAVRILRTKTSDANVEFASVAGQALDLAILANSLELVHMILGAATASPFDSKIFTNKELARRMTEFEMSRFGIHVHKQRSMFQRSLMRIIWKRLLYSIQHSEEDLSSGGDDEEQHPTEGWTDTHLAIFALLAKRTQTLERRSADVDAFSGTFLKQVRALDPLFLTEKPIQRGVGEIGKDIRDSIRKLARNPSVDTDHPEEIATYTGLVNLGVWLPVVDKAQKGNTEYVRIFLETVSPLGAGVEGKAGGMTGGTFASDLLFKSLVVDAGQAPNAKLLSFVLTYKPTRGKYSVAILKLIPRHILEEAAPNLIEHTEVRLFVAIRDITPQHMTFRDVKVMSRFAINGFFARYGNGDVGEDDPFVRILNQFIQYHRRTSSVTIKDGLEWISRSQMLIGELSPEDLMRLNLVVPRTPGSSDEDHEERVRSWLASRRGALQSFLANARRDPPRESRKRARGSARTGGKSGSGNGGEEGGAAGELVHKSAPSSSSPPPPHQTQAQTQARAQNKRNVERSRAEPVHVNHMTASLRKLWLGS